MIAAAVSAAFPSRRALASLEGRTYVIALLGKLEADEIRENRFRSGAGALSWCDREGLSLINREALEMWIRRNERETGRRK